MVAPLDIDRGVSPQGWGRTTEKAMATATLEKWIAVAKALEQPLTGALFVAARGDSRYVVSPWKPVLRRPHRPVGVLNPVSKRLGTTI